ncbi:rhodanese-like domain-containing protein [Streptomyces sp. S3(2020)]|uniref:rhodanese-like domain-containing protein n=1 Tax=Streptomyces sp. S3(2020) TaxID=2732044 RepID=UPI001489CBB9|nr:rhodanese-like domain-containing protein [Streptomyces sp. S3(2020)]NNN31705.1 rhodanese-like domain-containing protein [Streptomyces sp. S3(2020)]
MDDSSRCRVSVAEAHRLLRDGAAVLVDVREPDEFRAGHVPGALHVPLSRELPDSGDMILICRSGNRSRQAVALLAARGVECVDVIGGMRDWAAQGLPVEDAYGAAGVVI